jgi:tetratricopeptide (TPR) repeat protein
MRSSDSVPGLPRRSVPPRRQNAAFRRLHPMNPRAADAERLRQQLRLAPNDRIAWHNLASAEGDLGRVAEAEFAARKALALGLEAPETRLVLARALQSQRKLDEAEKAFRDAIARRPTYIDAHRDLAQLVWMRTGQVSLALSRLERALRAAPREAGLHVVRSTVLEFAGDLEGARVAAEAGLEQVPGQRDLLRQAAHLSARLGDVDRAVTLAGQAVQGAADGSAERIAWCEALLAAGRIDEAEPVAAGLVAALPDNQYAIALQGVVWRLRGDPRYGALYDYERLVGVQRLEAPSGWSGLDAFLADVAAELESLHAFRAHPLQQSVRGGSQLHLQAPEFARPPIAALFDAIGVAVRRHLANVGPGAGPLRSRNRGNGAVTGAWSVRLRSGGFHTDHVHPRGWLSSACYIALPGALGDGVDGHRAGWLRLGQPAIPTRPALEAEHFVRPEPGMLALFPAYMWHGVVPFEDERPRLTVAFDVVPA